MLSWVSALALGAVLQGQVLPAQATRTPLAAVPAADTDWAKRPSAADLAKFFPEKATAEKLNGEVSLACTVDASGALSRCSVSSETPAGYGFGEAALKLAASYAIRSERAVLWSASNHPVLVPIRFRAPEPEPEVEKLPPGFVPRDGRVPLPPRLRT